MHDVLTLLLTYQKNTSNNQNKVGNIKRLSLSYEGSYMKLMIGAISLSGSKYKSLHEFAKTFFDEIVLNPHGRQLTEDEVISLIKDCDAVVCGTERYTKRVLDEAPCLKVISKHGVGVDNIDLDGAKERGIVVCNTPGANAQAVAETAVALILDSLRKIPQAYMSVVTGNWKRPEGHLIQGKTLGILGMGNIGKTIIRSLEDFGVSFMAYDPFFDEDFAVQHNVKRATIDEILREADIISLHVPSTDVTRRMINRETLSKMKNSAILINTARGDLIDEEALFDALKNGVIAGAALDVLDEEPSYDNPLFQLDNIIITPHLAGNTAETTYQMGKRAIENAIAVLNDGTPKMRVC